MDLAQVSALFDSVVAKLRSETHDGLDAAAQAWVTRGSNMILQDLKDSLLKVRPLHPLPQNEH